MRGLASGMVLLLASTLGALAAAPTSDELLWCSSAFYWLATDAYDSGEEEEATSYEAWSEQLLQRGEALLAADGLAKAKIEEIVEGYAELTLNEMGTPEARYDVTTCPALLEE